jgi:hypothetical protein
MAYTENPDAAQDYQEICDVVEQKLVPTFETLGKVMKEIDDKATQALCMVEKILGAMFDAVMGQKQGEFQELLSSKYSADLAPLDSFYSDTMGNKFSDQLIQELMKSDAENPDEFIAGKIGEAKTKYGKYLGIGAEPEAPELPPEEAAVNAEEEEAEVHPEPEVGVAVTKTKSKKPTPEDMAGLLGLHMSRV